MARVVRYALIGVGIIGLLFAIGYYLQMPGLEGLWPWSGIEPDTAGGSYTYGSDDPDGLPRLSFFFIASIAAAIALPNLWIGLTREYAAITGGAINLMIMFSALMVFLLQSYATRDHGRLLVAAAVCLGGAAVSAGLLFWAWRHTFRDQRPTPAPVWLAFAVFAVTLLLVGGALILKQPNVFPWPLSTEASVVYGWVFLGAAAYFTYGLLVPCWPNACGQLLGFLAYDVVLILPYLGHFSTVAPERRTSLIIYTLVISISGLLALFYLFLNPGTRFRLARSAG